MSKELRIILLVLLGVFVIIQIIPANRPQNENPGDYDFFEANNVPDNIEQLIRSSCFDCHSQEVKYPWYSYVAPVSWIVSRDVRMGRTHLDFSKWNKLEKRDRIKMASEIGEEVEEGTMPMAIYILMHAEADLSQEQRESILVWSEQFAEQLFEE